MTALTQLKVAGVIVLFVAIDMMDRFMRQENPSKLLCHNESMLKTVATGRGSMALRHRNEGVVC